MKKKTMKRIIELMAEEIEAREVIEQGLRSRIERQKKELVHVRNALESAIARSGFAAVDKYAQVDSAVVKARGGNAE